MKEQKELRLFITSGYYDLATPVYAARYTMSHTDAPANRIIYSFFPTGHSIFENEEQLGKLIKQIRDFISDTPKKNYTPIRPDWEQIPKLKKFKY